MFFRRKKKNNFEDEFGKEKIEEEKRGVDSKAEKEKEDKKRALKGIKELDLNEPPEGEKKEGLDLKSTLEEIAEKTSLEDLRSEKENLEKEIEELKRERESVKNDIVTLSKQLNRMMRVKKALEEKLKDTKDALS